MTLDMVTDCCTRSARRLTLDPLAGRVQVLIKDGS